MKKFKKLLDNLSRINFCIALFIIFIGLIIACINEFTPIVIERSAQTISRDILVDKKFKEAEVFCKIEILNTIRKQQEENQVDLESLSTEDLIDYYISDICKSYPNVDPEIIKSQVYYESRYKPDVVGGDGAYLGLMQISPRWHSERASKLGVSDLMDIHGNLLVGIDYMSELISNNDLPLALMIYNGVSDPYTKYANGELNIYAKNVLTRAGYLGGDEYAS